MILLSESLPVVRRCLGKGQLKAEAKSRHGCLGGVGKKSCHPRHDPEFESKEQIQWFLFISIHILLNKVKAGKIVPGG